jgi:pantoate--beta-alanine ligase
LPSTISKYSNLNPSAVEIVDGNSLQTVCDWKDGSYIVGCITVFCGA